MSLRLPSIIIPSPYVADNHQYKNGLTLVKKQAAVMIEEKDLVDDILVKTIDELMNDENRLNEMKKNLEGMTIDKSATKIYDVLKKLVGVQNDKENN